MQTIKNIHKKKRSFPLRSLFLSTSLEEIGKMQETFWSKQLWNVYKISLLVCYCYNDNWMNRIILILKLFLYCNLSIGNSKLFQYYTQKFLMLTIEWKYLQMSSKGFCRYFTKDALTIFLQQMHFAVEADFASKLCRIILHFRSRCK